MNPESNPQPHPPGSGDPLAGLSPLELLRAADDPAPPVTGAPSLEEVAEAFPRWEILGLLGQGGMGFVYKARQPDLDRVVALKILRPELGRDPAFAERFAREARVLARLNHPNIVTVFEHGQAGRFFYLLMEHVDGVNLRQAMRAGRFTPEQALAIVPGICDALQAAHAQGIWHRDIKPENILLDPDGRVKIVDFGIARIVGDPARDFTLTLTGAALGSAPYMAPEQHERPHEVDHRADIYSLGVVFYEMLTGELPLGRFPNPSERAAVHARIDEIVLQTLEKERELRQQSATEVKTDIQRAARDGGNAAAGPAPAPSRAESWFSRLPSLVSRSVVAWLGGLLLLGTGFALQENRISGAAFPLSIGAVAAALGLVGGLWSLFEMRRGWLPATGRGLVQWSMFMPLLTAVGGFGAAVGFVLVAESGLPYLLCVPVAFASTLLLAWPLRHFLIPGFGKPRGWIITACLLLLATLVGGKFPQGQWPFNDARVTRVTLMNIGPARGDPAVALENLRTAAGDGSPVLARPRGQGSNWLDLEAMSPGAKAGPETERHFRSIVARLNQLTDPTDGSWILGDYTWLSASRTNDLAMVVIVLTGLSALAALFLSGCHWRPGVNLVCASAIMGAVATVTPGWSGGQAEQRYLVSMDPLPLFKPDELPREVDFSSPETAARTIVLAAHRGQHDILREAVSPAVATELDKHNEWEIFFQPGKVVNPSDLGRPFARPDPDRAFRDGSYREGYVLLDGKWKLDTLAFVSRPHRGPFTPGGTISQAGTGDLVRLSHPQRGPSSGVFEAAEDVFLSPSQRGPSTARETGEQPKPGVAVQPAEDPVATVRLLNRLANEQNAEAFLARKWRGMFSLGSDIPATRHMAPFYGEILNIGELPREAESAKVVVKFKRPDGKEDYREIGLTLEKNEWQLLTENAAEYRAWTLVEFNPPQGNAQAVLKNHLADKPFHPVRGSGERFLIGGEDRSAEDARRDADRRAERLKASLKEAGLDRHYRILVPAPAPAEPWMGGEPVAPEFPAVPPADP